MTRSVPRWEAQVLASDQWAVRLAAAAVRFPEIAARLLTDSKSCPAKWKQRSRY
jgi:hypothetical protein